MPTIKSFQPSPRLALPTLQLGTQLKALAATGTITPLPAISTEISLSLVTLLALENKPQLVVPTKISFWDPFPEELHSAF